MTPAHTDSPLRRSEAVIFRDAAQNQRPHDNDDDEERRQARRRTLLNSTSDTDSSTLEQSETLKKCLEIFHENKLSRDNAWSVSLIDTLSTLLDRHHKSLNNFTVAGSSLEASSKVYGLRVDSVHTDVLRMSAGLNARKFRNDAADEDDVATGGEGGADPNSSAATGVDQAMDAEAAKNRKAKRTRKAVATVTKNKETLNARLDTVPLQDPVFGKLNSTVGSINASNRLMNNILHTVDAELRLRMTHKFWDADNTVEDCDYTVPVPLDNLPDSEFLPCERLSKLSRFENQLLRPLNSGYVITDTPEPTTEDKERVDKDLCSDGASSQDGGGDEMFLPGADTAMAFDINADCEPMPELNSYAPLMAVDENDDDYTAEEHTAIAHCRGLRKQAVVIEDMRPVDSTSSLEYSYRPVEKISQFWAGPSHWRFRRTRHRSSAIGQAANSHQETVGGRTLNARNRRQNALQSKKRLKVEFAAPIHDAQFIMLDAKYKARKANVQKKWDQRKLRLPTDLQLNAEKLTYRRFFAPAFSALSNDNDVENDDADVLPLQLEDNFHTDEDHDDLPGAIHDVLNANDMSECADAEAGRLTSYIENNNHTENEVTTANETILEIATDFEGAPRQVTKIIVPFAKRAKVIDMKNLKRTCSQLISKQFRDCKMTESEMPRHPIEREEHYTTGLASFQDVYKNLPALLSPAMAEGLTTSIALYSVLHLANDFSYRLIPQDDLKDFKIRQVNDD